MNLILAAALIALAAPAAAIPLCGQGPRFTCVVDGDTVWIDGEKIRIINIDTPELRAECPQEALQAAEAQKRLAALLTGDLVIQRDGRDRYGRTLATIRAGGKDVGEQLVREGLARRWTGRREGWCGD